MSVAENNDLSRELEDVQSKLTQVTRLKASLTSQIDELKRQVDEENKVYATTDTHSSSILFSSNILTFIKEREYVTFVRIHS